MRLLFERINLEDGWELAPIKKYTWTTNRTGQQVYSTLDRVMLTNNAFDLIDKDTDWALSVSDHAAVTASINFKKEKSSNKPMLSRLDPRIL